MDKDIEKIIDESVIPEMEYVRTSKHKTGYVEVPEIVLPKTRAEEYLEAKDRLEQETSAVSKAYKPGRKKSSKSNNRTIAKTKSEKVKTVELDSAAAAAVGAASNAEREDLDKLRERLDSLKKTVEEPKWVGSADEIIPFGWKNPLIPDIARPSKFYKAAIKAEKIRADLLPTPRD